MGWTDGRNVQIEYRLGASDGERTRRDAAELLALTPDVILANGTSAVGPLLEATRTVPIVFVQVSDPVGAGYVASLARPGGNATGVSSLSYGIAGKRLELLREVVPSISRIAVLWNPGSPIMVIQEKETRAAAEVLGIEIRQPALVAS